MKTQSLWYTGKQELELRTIDIPEPGPGEVLVEVYACGICTWDLYIYSGGFQETKAFPFYFGHEGIGRVAKCGPGADVTEGQRVALRETPNIGVPGTGHMAELAIHRASELILLPEDEVPDHLFLIEPTACCVNALNISPVLPGNRVALVGAGYMGSIILQLLNMSPASEVVVYERRQEALTYSRSFQSGAPIQVIDTSVEAVTQDDRGSFDLVFETTGVEPGFRLADSLVRNGGRFCVFGWQHHPFEFDFGSWHVRGLTVHNSSPGEAHNFSECFLQSRDLIHSGRVDQGPLITHVGTPEEARDIYGHGLAKTDGYVKGVIRWR